MSTTEIALGFAYLVSTLTGDATLQGYAPGGVYRALAPPQTVAPYIILMYQAGTTVTNFGAVRGYVSVLYQVKAVGPAKNTQALVNAAARIDGLITRSVPLAVTGGIIKSCVQQSPLEYDEPPIAGEQWTNMGGLYRILVSAT